MKLQSTTDSKVVNTQVNNQVDAANAETQIKVVAPQLPERTFGQKLADKMASKVGSWGFLIGQTTVLTAWVGCNLTPGMPHWDESPFILLNLVFSFASAYTAPVVLMSQNRQSEEDRQHAMQNHQVNLQTAQNLELLHQKMDAMYSQKLAELTTLIQQQAAQQATHNTATPAHQAIPAPQFNYVGLLPSNVAQSQQSHVLPMVEMELFTQASQQDTSVDSSECN